MNGWVATPIVGRYGRIVDAVVLRIFLRFWVCYYKLGYWRITYQIVQFTVPYNSCHDYWPWLIWHCALMMVIWRGKCLSKSILNVGVRYWKLATNCNCQRKCGKSLQRSNKPKDKLHARSYVDSYGSVCLCSVDETLFFDGCNCAKIWKSCSSEKVGSKICRTASFPPDVRQSRCQR